MIISSKNLKKSLSTLRFYGVGVLAVTPIHGKKYFLTLAKKNK